jgi:DNA processing protein
MDPAERNALLRLTLAPGLGPTLIGRALAAFGTPGGVLAASIDRLAAVKGIGRNRAAAALAFLRDGECDQQLDTERRLIDQHAVRLVALDDGDYPALLRHIPDPPPLLYVRGELLESDALALAIVGSRRCTHYGREQADRFAVGCTQAGLCIVSGGAYGIDVAAHRAAVRVHGRTIAVIGSGLANPYPAEHTDLFDQIAGSSGPGSGCGAVVSELPMTTPPRAENFPRRNRIVSGMALGVLVIEAPTRSGALITARIASEEHNREVMAVPGKVDSANSGGCHKIIREGWATLVTNAAEVLDALGETGQLLKAGVTLPPDRPPDETVTTLFTQNLTPSQQRIVDALNGTASPDQLSAATGLAVSVVQADLTMLQIRGLVRKEGLRFVRQDGR